MHIPVVPDLATYRIVCDKTPRSKETRPIGLPLLIDMAKARLIWNGCAKQNHVAMTNEVLDKYFGELPCDMFSDFKADGQIIPTFQIKRL